MVKLDMPDCETYHKFIHPSGYNDCVDSDFDFISREEENKRDTTLTYLLVTDII